MKKLTQDKKERSEIKELREKELKCVKVVACAVSEFGTVCYRCVEC
jgi:peroxiredoxin family protein